MVLTDSFIHSELQCITAMHSKCVSVCVLCVQMQYDESHVYFKCAYDIACNMATMSRLQKAQGRVGTSRALSMLQAYYKHMEMPGRHSIQKIIMWKEKRQENFIEPVWVDSPLKTLDHIKLTFLKQGASAATYEIMHTFTISFSL